MGLSGCLLLLGGERRSLLCASVASSGCGRLSRVWSLLVVGIFPTLQSLEVDLGDSLVEGLALGGSELQLLLGRLAGTITTL